MIGFIGIDLSKDWMDAQLAAGTERGVALDRLARDKKACKEMLKRAKELGITELHVAMEATGSYWQEIADHFFEAGVSVYVVNPARIKAQRRVTGKRTKTDRIDAGVILSFVRTHFHDLFRWSPPSEAVRRLQDLVRYREQVVKHRTAAKSLKKSKPLPELQSRIKKKIKDLNKEVAELEELIAFTIDSDEVLKRQFARADSVPGIGIVNGAILLSECRAFAEIRDPRQATAFAGLDVRQDSSGKYTGKSHISKQGSPLLRRAMVNAAASASQRANVFREFYLRRCKTLLKPQALTATARKLLEVTVAVVLSDVDFDKERNLAA